MNFAIKFATFASLSIALAACAGSSSDEAPNAGDETAQSQDEALLTNPKVQPGCGWILHRGTFCPMTATGVGPTCYPAPAHPGYHWDLVCGCY
jgi:hypothetical protein